MTAAARWLRAQRSLLILLAVVIGSEGAVYWQAAAAVARAARAAATEVQLCEAGNTYRAEQAALWDYVIKISGPPRTAAQRGRLALFERHLRQVSAPRNCQAPLTARRTHG